MNKNGEIAKEKKALSNDWFVAETVPSCLWEKGIEVVAMGEYMTNFEFIGIRNIM